MNEQTLTDAERRLLDAWLKQPGAPALSPEQLADWLAGRLAEDAAAGLEAALARDPGLRAALQAVREGAEEAATEFEIARARALLPARRSSGFRVRLDWGWQSLAAACLVAAACGLGWMLGLGFGGDAVSSVAASAAGLFGSGAGL